MSWLSERLAKLMQERGESTEALARQLGIERSRLAKIIAGSAFPNENLVKRISRHFGEDTETWLAHTVPRQDSKPKPGLPGDFVKVASLREIPDGEMRVVLNGLVVLANSAGRFHAFGNVCPHAGGPIGEGFLDGLVVECPWHAGQWDIVSGKALTPLATADIPIFEVRVTGEDIEIKPTQAALAQGVVSASPRSP